MKPTNKIKILFLVFCIFLQGCSENPSIHKAFKVGLPNQTFRENLVVQKKIYYRFSLIFNWRSDVLEQALEQEKIIGSDFTGGTGVALPLHVKITKNDDVFLDEIFVTHDRNGTSGFCLDETTGEEEPQESLIVGFFTDIRCTEKPNRRSIWGPGRTIMGTFFSPGEYLIEIKTIEPRRVEAFSEMESFIEITPYSPKI